MENLKLNGKRGLLRVLPLLLIFLSLSCTPTYSKDIDVGVHLRDGDVRDFYFAISDYYRVPIREVYVLRERYPVITCEELPIFFLIVREARVEPDLIIRYRKIGYSWFDIMIRFGLRPERVFERYIVVDGPPYGKAWGYYKKHPRKVLIIRDPDIIELSNIKFISDYYNERPERIVEIKRKYKSYVDLQREMHHKHKNKRERERENFRYYRY